MVCMGFDGWMTKNYHAIVLLKAKNHHMKHVYSVLASKGLMLLPHQLRYIYTRSFSFLWQAQQQRVSDLPKGII